MILILPFAIGMAFGWWFAGTKMARTIIASVKEWGKKE